MVSEKSQKSVRSQFSLSNYSSISNEYLHGKVINAIPGIKYSVPDTEARSFR